MNKTPNRMHALALSVGLALAMPAAAGEAQPEADSAGFHARLMQQLREFQQRALQPEWVNRWAPGLSATAPAAVPESADRRLQAIVAMYTRDRLDRGGWVNPWVGDGNDAAGEPLLAVAVGSGVTTRGEPARQPAPLVAGR